MPLVGGVKNLGTNGQNCDSYLWANHEYFSKNCPQTSFPGRREASNILHGGKMLAPHFKDENASLQKWPFLAGF